MQGTDLRARRCAPRAAKVLTGCAHAHAAARCGRCARNGTLLSRSPAGPIAYHHALFRGLDMTAIADAPERSPRAEKMFIVLSGFFVANAIIAEFIGVKIFALEDTLGIAPLDWNLFGQTGSLNFTAGVLLWPIVFVMTDIINEYFGRKGVRMISWLAVGLIIYAYLFAFA